MQTQIYSCVHSFIPQIFIEMFLMSSIHALRNMKVRGKDPDLQELVVCREVNKYTKIRQIGRCTLADAVGAYPGLLCPTSCCRCGLLMVYVHQSPSPWLLRDAPRVTPASLHTSHLAWPVAGNWLMEGYGSLPLASGWDDLQCSIHSRAPHEARGRLMLLKYLLVPSLQFLLRATFQ